MWKLSGWHLVHVLSIPSSRLEGYQGFWSMVTWTENLFWWLIWNTVARLKTVRNNPEKQSSEIIPHISDGKPRKSHFEGVRTKSTSESAIAQFMTHLEDGLFTKNISIFLSVGYSQKVLDQPFWSCIVGFLKNWFCDQISVGNAVFHIPSLGDSQCPLIN